MADFEDANSPDLGERHRRPDQPERRRPRARSRSTTRRRQAVPPERARPRRSSCARAAGTCRRSTCSSTASRSPARSSTSASSSSTTHEALARARHGPVLLPAEDGEPPRGAPLERRLRRTPRRRSASPRGHDQGDGADRDDPGGVRDGRDPLRAARALGGPQLRPLGLHLQLHQEARGTDPDCVLPDRVAGHDGQALPRGLRRRCSSRPATAAARTRWAAWPRRSRSRTTRRPTRRRSRRCAPTSCARSKDGHDGTWVAHPGLVPDRDGDLRRAHAGPEPARRLRATTCSVTAADLLARARGHAHRGGPAPQHPRRRPVPRGLAARQRLRAALQPDGGRGDRGDLAARRSGSGCTTARRSTTASRSRSSASPR